MGKRQDMSKQAEARAVAVRPTQTRSTAQPSTAQGWGVEQVVAATSPEVSGTAASGEVISLLDPRTIRATEWANRHPQSFKSIEFEKLKSSIAQVGRNIQAIKVRPIPADRVRPADVNANPPLQFELVFGHRRHRACLELGVPVGALVETMSDEALFAEMDRENRTHKALSPFEQGLMFKLALESGLYSSARALAQDLRLDESIVSKSLTIARLPAEVIRAFITPLDIQYRWAGPLSEAHRRDPAGLIARAGHLQSDQRRLSAVRIFQRLVAAEPSAGQVEVHIEGRCGHASVEVDRKGRLAILIAPPWDPGLAKRAEIAIRALLDQQ